jgi:hypothetical protein
MVGWTDRRVQEYPEQWPENCQEHRMEKCPEQIRPEGRGEAAGKPAEVGVPLPLVVVFILESVTVDSGTLSD